MATGCGAAVLNVRTLQELDLSVGVRHGRQQGVAFTVEMLWREGDWVQQDFPIAALPKGRFKLQLSPVMAAQQCLRTTGAPLG